MPKQTRLPDIIGNTPLIHLRRVSELTGCEIYGKAEFMNPGGSVKDRTALGIIRDAEARGELRPGGVIVEGTAGNTGIGLTLVANALGYQSVIVMPQSASKEKITYCIGKAGAVDRVVVVVQDDGRFSACLLGIVNFEAEAASTAADQRNFTIKAAGRKDAATQ